MFFTPLGNGGESSLLPWVESAGGGGMKMASSSRSLEE